MLNVYQCQNKPSDKMKLKLNKEILVNKFLTPVSRVSEKCVISLYKDHIQTLTTTSEGNPILYALLKTTCDLEDKNELILNIPNINKLIRMFNCINSDEIELEINSNNIEYKSLNMNFKYFLLEDGVIERTPVSVDKITALRFDSEFTIDKERMLDIIKGTGYSTDSKKIYFYMKDGNVHAELTDKEIENTNSVSYFIANNFSGTEIKKPILIDLEIFKMFFGIKENILVKISTSPKIVMFKFNSTDYALQYIVSPLVK